MSSLTAQTIVIASDHRGYAIKESLLAWLRGEGVAITDFGPDNAARCDFPIYAARVAGAVAAGEFPCGILICSNGIGMSIAANKVHGIRAALAWRPEVAEMARRHNDVQILCLPGDYVSPDLARQIVTAWLTAPFEGGRYAQRVAMIEEQEKNQP
jgi:ribose 5-phosphate isomerase B